LSKLAKGQEKSRPSNTHDTFSQKNTLVPKKTPRICTPVQICQHEKMLTNSHFALKPSQRTALTTFFQKLSKLAQGPSKIATIKYPQCLFAKKCTLVPKKTPRICTPVQICQHEKMLTNSHFAVKPSQRTALTTFFQKLSKLAQGPRKIATIKYPQCIFAKKTHWFPRKHQEFVHQYKFVNMKKC